MRCWAPEKRILSTGLDDRTLSAAFTCGGAGPAKSRLLLSIWSI